MAEIKSAIELAMERTRNLVMDEEEKKESRRRDGENRLKAVLRRYLEGIIEEDGAMAEVEEIELDSPLKRRILMDFLLDELHITRENDRLISLIKRVAGGLPDSLMEDLKTMEDGFAREMEKRAGSVREEVTLRLEKMGITGDGIEPNVETWEEWDHAREETGYRFEGQLEGWKERLSRAMGEG